MREISGVSYVELSEMGIEDPFVLEVAGICGILIPVSEWESTQDKQSLVKGIVIERVRKYQQDSINLGWSMNPEPGW